MRFVHFSDIHIGMENYGSLDPATGLSSRLTDFLSALDQVIDYALGSNVDMVVFSGDAYKTRDPSPTHQREFAKRLRRLADAGLPVFLLVGNHDLPNALGRAHAIEIFDTLAVHGMRVARTVTTVRMETRKGPIQIVALPWVVRSNLLTRDDYKNLTLPELDHKIREIIARGIEHEVEALDRSAPAILAVHASVEGAVFGSERNVMLGQDIIIPKSIVTNPAFSYVALGHIHKHQVIAQDPPAIYAGSLERIDFGEERDKKGFVVVDLDDQRRATWQFVPVNARRFLTIRVDLGDDENPTDATVKAIGEHHIKDAVVKLVLHARRDFTLREDEVRRALGDAYYVAAISRDVERTARDRFGGVEVAQMTTQQALEAYLKAKDVPEARAKALLERAARLNSEPPIEERRR